MKNYMLLRDNHQSGPYTAESLKKMMLRKFDLIWIEGESIIWKYPSEIKELRRFAPQAEITEATKVNSMKEKQMLYFQACIHEMKYKANHTLLSNPWNALWDEVPAGFEYMTRTENLRVVENENIGEESTTEETVHDTPDMPDYSYDYTVLGESQIVDTPEVAANVSVFTSTIEMPVRYKRTTAIRKPNDGKKRKQIAPGITGLLTLIAMVFVNIKL